MAELVVYDFHGPGEQKTAETLAASLPESWIIIVGRSLPTPQGEDVDLVVIGANRVFCVEEKAWGPTVRLRNGGWEVKGNLRPSPLGRNRHVSRVLAGVLKEKVGGYKRAIGHHHVVIPIVVLSHPRLSVEVGEDSYETDSILALDEASQALLDLDASETALGNVRSEVVEFLSGLEARSGTPEKLGPYTVSQELAPVGTTRVFVGADDLDRPVVLKCYPMDGWGPDDDPKHVIRRERQAIQAIADIHRSWSTDPVFEVDARRWIVVPLRPEPSVSLRRHVAAAQIQIRDEGKLTERARSIIDDAFLALAEVHGKGLLHRGLMPERVLLGKNDRVLFRDFYLARASDMQTIAVQLADIVDESAPYRAPECATFIGDATPESDVYSLALSLLWWINQDLNVQAQEEILAIGASIERFDPIISILVECLDPSPENRPTAERVVEQIASLEGSADASVLVPAADETSKDSIAFAVGETISDRYRIIRELGRGGFATSWLVDDTIVQAQRVLKQYHNASSARTARHEFEAAAKLMHHRCARVWDYSPTEPVYLVTDYVEGQSLTDVGSEGAADEEDYRRIALDALEGLAYMHREGHLHRDVSPNNIIVGSDKRARLIDFGLMASIEHAVSIAGTRPYIAPEVEQSGEWSASADLYALGVSLVRVMLARLPYAQGPGGQQLFKHDVRRLSAEEVETWGVNGEAILEALFRLVEPEPDHRPNSAQEFADFLRTVSPPSVVEGEDRINTTVDQLRRLYRGSSAGNAGNRGLDDEFARETYVETKLDTILTPRVIAGDLDVVLLTGNPGDGKTAFLATLREVLLKRGATELATTPAGWRAQLGDRTFAALYDASEARDGKSSDELMIETLTGEGEHTALVAVNDGRLMAFFNAYSDVYPECYVAVNDYAAGKPNTHPRIAVVDLKRRSLAPTKGDQQGLAGRVLASFTQDAFWETCEGCRARDACPILANRNLLASTGAAPLLELVSVSHLRRKRRATFRDVRSALAWTITGDRTCSDVHGAINEGVDLRLAEDSMAFDLAFAEENPDYLVAEWSLLDPANLAAPAVERAVRDGTLALETQMRPASRNRQLFFVGANHASVSRSEVRAYRYYDEFLAALAGDQSLDELLPIVLSGLSRVLGAHGYRGQSLALRDGESGGWSVLREVNRAEFSLRPEAFDPTFVEHQADALRLHHRMGSLLLTLDSYEMVRRASDGEVLGDAAAESVKLELDAFGNALRRTPGRVVQVVDPAGNSDAVSVVDGVIVREGASV